MKFNFKAIVVGGIVFYIAQWVVGMITGILIHEGVLDQLYLATTEYWRPELVQDPPDMAALMPRWIATGLVMSFIFVGVYDNIREAFSGSAIVQGFKYGLLLALLFACMYAGLSGVFNLPETIWAWWIVDGFIVMGISGLALGWYVGKWGD
ncbi:MAG: hypothetical protein GWM87_13550 [Xanthomonadales bacterium]|nr:hypothetical protein [Xanthomonadales bacterium]NIX13840.1 hypothetical protein [Xanthomonadales bacterium]